MPIETASGSRVMEGGIGVNKQASGYEFITDTLCTWRIVEVAQALVSVVLWGTSAAACTW